MKCLLRNKVPFYYCRYAGEAPIYDSEGNEAGKKVLYTEPVRADANISPATGNSSAEMFGTSIRYDKVIVCDDPGFPIDEYTVLFIDREPAFDSDGNPLFDYVVKKVAPSLNSVSIAVARVEVSE